MAISADENRGMVRRAQGCTAITAPVMATKPFPTEAALCAQFIELIDKRIWTPYAETQGWDILLVRRVDGFQIGIQAKLSLNIDVIAQAIESSGHWSATAAGPDCRAVLVPEAAGQMVVHQPAGLHEGIDGGRPDEFPAALFQRLGQGHRGGRGGAHLGRGVGFFKAPDEGGQRAGGRKTVRPAPPKKSAWCSPEWRRVRSRAWARPESPAHAR